MYISKITLTNKGYSLIDNIGKNNSTSIKNNNSNQPNHTGISLPLNYYTHLNYYSKPLSFMGKNVYIVDGGTHATNMEHFAHAISKDMDTEIFEVSTIYNNPNMKSLKGLEMQLRNLRKNRNLKNAYVAVPALASVPLLNIQDQYNAVMNDNKKFTPENIKSHKKQILDFLKVIYHAPNNYRKYIDYMDKNHQGIEYVYGVINEINKLKEAGAKVYVPTGHPQDETLKWMVKEKGLKPEFYHFIATGQDKDGLIFSLHEQIKNNNWYDFNLLALSNANIVGVKGAKGPQDYMFAAYDSCVTDGERGVYNFSPVRNNGRIIGYSYTDTVTNEYPFEEFPNNGKLFELNKYVGKNLSEVLATEAEHEELKKYIEMDRHKSLGADKLYRIKDVFPPYDIEKYKLNLQGEFVDRTLSLFFNKNNNNEVIFQKCDCEGSGKPSVLSMWGSCFAVFNAIARDIKIENTVINPKESITSHKKNIRNILKQAHLKRDIPSEQERLFKKALLDDKAFVLANPEANLMYEPYLELGMHYMMTRNYEHASGCLNKAIDLLADDIINRKQMHLRDIENLKHAYEASIDSSETYEAELYCYEHSGFINQLITRPPEKPSNYNKFKENEEEKCYLMNAKLDAEKIFKTLARICSIKNEKYPEKVCLAAYKDIKEFSDRGTEVLKARANGVQYIGDLYNEIKPN